MILDPKEYANPREHLQPLGEDPHSGITTEKGSSGLAKVVTAFLSDQYEGQTTETTARDYEPVGDEGAFTFDHGGNYDWIDNDLLGGTGDGTRSRAYYEYATTVDPLRVEVWCQVHDGWKSADYLAAHSDDDCDMSVAATLRFVNSRLHAALIGTQPNDGEGN